MTADSGLSGDSRHTTSSSGGLEGSGEALKRPESPALSLPRDQYGRFLPTKRPLEFTWPHFWLEVVEVTVAIIFGSAIYDLLKLGFQIWLLKLLVNL